MSALNDPRVLFSAERTLMSWNRTSLSIIAFGFVVERGGLLNHAVYPDSESSVLAAMTFWLGLVFIALGSFVSAYSAWQYAEVLRTLSATEFPPGYAARWGMVVNAVVAILGLLLIVALVVGRE